MLYTSSPKTFLVPRVITWSFSEQAGSDTDAVLDFKACIEDLFAAAMPRYELALILKSMQRPETAAALRRTIETLMERGAVVRDLENLGERLLPYTMTKHNQNHKQGSYFLIDFYSAPIILTGLLNHLHRDVDVVRPTVLRKDAPVSSTNCCGPREWLNVRKGWIGVKCISACEVWCFHRLLTVTKLWFMCLYT